MKRLSVEHCSPTAFLQLMGLEPTLKYMDMNLNHARMPSPPQLQAPLILPSLFVKVNTFSAENALTTQVANLPSVGSLPVRALGTHVADFVRFRLLTLCLAGNYMFPRVISQNPPAFAGVCALAYHSNLAAKYAFRSSIFTRSCSMVSRSRTVTQPSFSESKS